jgi:CBS domain-containing protein
MQTRVVTVSVTERLSTVDDIMRLGGVRHMPVVHQGHLVGVLSERDLLRASLSQIGSFDRETHRAFLHAIAIAEVMSKPPITVRPDESVPRAARVMAERKIGCLPVVVDEVLLGLLTETDVLGWVAQQQVEPQGRIPATRD